MNIFLIGFMGAGKSTISAALGEMLSMEVIEMDELIVKRQGMSIPQIFETHGEAYFRELETGLLAELEERSGVIVSCGGGTAMRECNVEKMRHSGSIVLLTASPETILERVKDSHDRPLLENNKTVEYISELLGKRQPKYDAAADLTVATDGKNAETICHEIVGRLLFRAKKTAVPELVKKNRSYRGFDTSVSLGREDLLSLVDLTRYTASSVNEQPLRYYIAWKKEEVAKILPLTMWAKALKETKLPHPGKEPAAFIIICQDMNISSNTTRFQRDVGIVAQTMLLGAVEKGLGGCLIGSFYKPELKKLLNLPESLEPNLLLALGKPAETVVLTEVGEDGSTGYFRDENDVHYVPKRSLSALVLEAE